MAFKFDTAEEYVQHAAHLANDADQVRYTQHQYFGALNAGVREAFRVRPDIYRSGTPPTYDPAAPQTAIDFPQQYAMHLVAFMVGWLELTDSEGNEDQRAAALISSFSQKLAGR